MISPHLETLQSVEARVDTANNLFLKGLEGEDGTSLQDALTIYESALHSEPLEYSRDSLDSSMAATFFTWVARPLRLHCLHRIAGSRELLREDLRMIAKAGSSTDPDPDHNPNPNPNYNR